MSPRRLRLTLGYRGTRYAGWAVQSPTRTRGRPTDKSLRGYWRNRMRTRFNHHCYGQRWQAETVHSMIKRTMDSALRARTYHSQSREIILRILTHNIMILRRRRVFYRACQERMA